MEFELSEEQQQVKMSVREFAESEMAPHVMEWDESQHFPVELLPKLAELGLMGVYFDVVFVRIGLGAEFLNDLAIDRYATGGDKFFRVPA